MSKRTQPTTEARRAALALPTGHRPDQVVAAEQTLSANAGKACGSMGRKHWGEIRLAPTHPKRGKIHD